jgi:exopolysaccharide biosynthesis protein
MYSVIIFIFTHVTKIHFSVFTKTREKQKQNKRKTRTDNVNHNHRFTDLQMSIVKALAIDHAQSELVQVV